MKKRSFLMAAFAAMFMASCSDNEMGQDNNLVDPDNGVMYTNISIAMAGSGTGARALGDDSNSFEEGEKDGSESAIKELLLVFYDATGHVMGNTTLNEDDLKKLVVTPTTTGNATLMYQGAVKVNLNPTNDTKPSQVMAYANPQGANDHRDPLSTIRTKVRDDYKVTTNGIDYFTMNNSVYYEGNNLVTAVAVNANDFYKTEAEALASTAEKTKIYLERMASKVILNQSESLVNEPFRVNDNTYLKFAITGWGLSGTEKKMFLIKNLPDLKSENAAGFATWAWNGTNRSYWAKSYSYKQGPNSDIHGNPDAQFPLYGESQEPENGWALDYITYAQATNQLGTAAYCKENTGRISKFQSPNAGNVKWNPYATTTNVVIAGTYTVTSDAAGNTPITKFGNNVDFYYFGSDIYLESEIKTNMVASQIFIYSDAACTTRVTGVTAFDFINTPTNAPSSHYFIQIPAVNEGLYCKYTDDAGAVQIKQLNTTENLAIANEQLKGRYVAVKFNQGHAFFSVPIEHYGKKVTGEGDAAKTEEVDGTYGVVRNHVYKLTVNSIKGLANGVDDDEPLIPEPTENVTWWVGCDTYVLQWHVVSQGVDL